jgi:basic membrane protein A
MGKHRLFAVAATVSALAVGMTACGSDDEESGGSASGGTASQERKSAGKAVMIGVAPVTLGNWDPAGFKAFESMGQKHGYETSNQESVGYDQAASVLRRVGRTNDLVIAHSSGYEAAVLEVAPSMTDTWFLVFSDMSTTNGLPNVAGWAVNWNEYGFLAGAAGCFAAKERGGDGVGHVNSEPIPAFKRYAAGVKAGAEEHGCKFQTRWINSFTDVAKAKQAGLSMIADGAEVITTSADTADEGSRDAAVEKDKLFIANYAPASDLAPEHTITSIVVNMDKAYDEMGALHASGELEAKVYPMTIANDGMSYESPFKNVDPKVQEQAEEVIQKIKDGDIKIDPKATVEP